MAIYKLNDPEYIEGVGVKLTWTYPDLTFDPEASPGTRIIIQRSATKANWPLQPFVVTEMGATPIDYSEEDWFHDETTPPPANTESEWITIKSWTTVGAVPPAEYIDQFAIPNPTYNYRIIMHIFQPGPGHWFEYNWKPATITRNPAGTFLSATKYGATGNDSVVGIAVDSNEDYYIAGQFKGTINLGGSNLTSVGGYVSMYIAKFDKFGTHQWSYRFGGTSDINVKALAIDSSGNLFVCGYHTGPAANFGGTDKAVAGQYNSFLVKYSSLGVHVWSKSFGSSNLAGTYINIFNDVCIDSTGAVIVVGTFKGTCNFGGDDLVSKFNAQVGPVLAKYANDGTHTFSKTFTNGNEAYSNGVCVDSSNNILMVGSFFSSVNFASNDSIDATITAVNQTYQNIFVVKFNSSGVHQWSFRRGGAFGDKAMTVAVDSANNVLVGGMFYKKTDLGGGEIVGGAVDLDSCVAKYLGTDGSFVWGKGIVGNNGCWVNKVKVDNNNNLVVTGFFYGTFTLVSGITIGSTLNSYDGWVAKYSTAGVVTWARSFGGSATDGSNSMTINRLTNQIYCVGAFTGNAQFGPYALSSNGLGDGFVAKITA